MQFSKSQPQKSLEKNKALSSALGVYFFPSSCCLLLQGEVGAAAVLLSRCLSHCVITCLVHSLGAPTGHSECMSLAGPQRMVHIDITIQCEMASAWVM